MIELLDHTTDPDALDGRHGAYTYAYLRDHIGNYRLRTAIENGQLIGFGRGVVLDADRVLDLRARAAGALLLSGGVLVGPTAAALHGCTAVGGFPVHVRVPYSHRVRSRPGMIVHQGDTRDGDTTTIDGLRVLTTDLAVADVLCTAPRRAALACADEALHALRPDDRAPFVARVTEHLATRPDRRGVSRAHALLALATGLPTTPTESAFVLVMADAGVPPPRCQYEIGRHRVDFAWPDERVALHCDHEREHDHAHEQLRRQGWDVLHADAQDLADPTAICTRLRTALTATTPAAA